MLFERVKDVCVEVVLCEIKRIVGLRRKVERRVLVSHFEKLRRGCGGVVI